MSIITSSEKKVKSVLIISSDLELKENFRQSLTAFDFQFFEATTPAEALPLIEKHQITVAFIDQESIIHSEMDIVSYLNASHGVEVIILATINGLDEATKALKNGAAFYLVKPVKPADLKSVIDKLSLRATSRENSREIEQRFLSDLMAGSPLMQKLLKFSMKIAPTPSTVLIGGESGTGKEFFAKIIHRMSRRSDGRFVAVNCGAIPDTLFESELFGHKKGSFTGADRDRAGIVEEAHMGTLFLDEVGELSLQSQVKLLRFLQDREFRRIGESTNRSVDVRIIAATNKDLSNLIKQGTFREDLYFRLNVFYLHLPPLRERRETLPNLIRLFVHRNNQNFDKNILHISKNAESLLAGYEYPGNIRELENIIEHAMVLAENDEITEKDLPEFMLRNRLLLGGPSSSLSNSAPDEILTLAQLEEQHIRMVLQTTDYNYTETSKKLGISRSTLWRKIKEFNIEER
ncbi:MAG: sigma-54-dependent Fis family transcriptional regulator [Chitinispirillaceae bacterium]|nr:sigma-54-dependent Fis family transcriptional regulator [Chitinispirillaceae bacterium]